MTPSESRSATPTAQQPSRRKSTRPRKIIAFLICAVVAVGAGALAAARPWSKADPPGHAAQAVRYLGVYQPDAPGSYSDLNQFARAIGRQPNLVSYYSQWGEPFQTNFAATAAKRGATTLVQIDPKNVSLPSIANRRYDTYLRSYAAAVKAFGGQVVLSFGHEMNGSWYPWANHHTSAAEFVAAWRHIVTVFRAVGAKNVTWLWTVNIVDTTNNHIPSPNAWWPGKSYVSWVGIDGYYYSPSQDFAQVFGPTIVDVRALTGDPILIAETGASIAAGQATKVTDMFSGIQAYGLLGFVWFDANSINADTGEALQWRLTSPAALATFRRDAKAFMRTRSKQTSGRQHPSATSSSP
jgi:mannan endo-1,4-beta-mannosidase